MHTTAVRRKLMQGDEALFRIADPVAVLKPSVRVRFVCENPAFTFDGCFRRLTLRRDDPDPGFFKPYVAGVPYSALVLSTLPSIGVGLSACHAVGQCYASSTRVSDIEHSQIPVRCS